MNKSVIILMNLFDFNEESESKDNINSHNFDNYERLAGCDKIGGAG